MSILRLSKGMDTETVAVSDVVSVKNKRVCSYYDASVRVRGMEVGCAI